MSRAAPFKPDAGDAFDKLTTKLSQTRGAIEALFGGYLNQSIKDMDHPLDPENTMNALWAIEALLDQAIEAKDAYVTINDAKLRSVG